MAQNSFDAFGRLRVSGTGQRLDAEFIYNKMPDLFDEVTSNGTVTHNANSRDLTLALSDANNGSYATMRSHPVPYTPGNSQLWEGTGTLNGAGISGGTTECFLRSSISGSVTEVVSEQSNWWMMRQNANYTLDWSKSHIFQIDFQSLKVGTIRFGIVHNGQTVPVTHIHNSNVRASGYWQLPSLQSYWRLYTTGGTTYMEIGYGDEANAVGFRHKVDANASATMRAVCCTVKSEGGDNLIDMSGFQRGTDRGVSPATVSTTLVPLISIRARSTFNSFPNLGLIRPNAYSAQSNEAVLLRVVEGGTLTGASWSNVDTNNSIAEVDTSASAISGGRVIGLPDYIYATSSGAAATRLSQSADGLLGKAILWDRQGSESGIISLCAVRTGAADASVLAALHWDELR